MCGHLVPHAHSLAIPFYFDDFSKYRFFPSVVRSLCGHSMFSCILVSIYLTYKIFIINTWTFHFQFITVNLDSTLSFPTCLINFVD